MLWQKRPNEAIAFSERELEIAHYIAAGLNAKEISERIFLSMGTVKNYTSSIYGKLRVSDRAKAVIVLNEILK